MQKKDEAGRSDNRRVQKVEREVRETIAEYLIKGFKIPISGLVTVSRINMPADFKSAKVYVSIIGTEDPSDNAEIVELLNERAFEVQSYIAKTLKMRFCPKLTFYFDDTLETVLKIEKIIDEVSKNRPKKDE